MILFFSRVIIFQAVLLMSYFLLMKKTRGRDVTKSLDDLGPTSILLVVFPFLGIIVIVPWMWKEIRRRCGD